MSTGMFFGVMFLIAIGLYMTYDGRGNIGLARDEVDVVTGKCKIFGGMVLIIGGLLLACLDVVKPT